LIFASNIHELGSILIERVDFAITGYDGDPRALWQIHEVREFVAELDRRFSGWMFYLHTDAEWLRVAFSCLASRMDSDGICEVDADLAANVIARWFHSLNVLADRFGTLEERIREISHRSVAQIKSVLG